MGYTTINISYNEGNLCEEITFSEPGNKSYVLGSTITLSDQRLSRDRSLVVMNVNHTEDESNGISTTVSGFSLEYKYTRKAPSCDISFFTMTHDEKRDYEKENPRPDSEAFIMYGDKYGVNGWSMHSIIQRIAEWMDLTIINNLPDYWISDFSISVGSTFFEALNSLVSEFEPLISLEGRRLYILERNGAGMLSGGGITPAGFTKRSVDGEYVPAPGCIMVEGNEGKYISSKDPTIPPSACARWQQWLEDHPFLPLPPEAMITPCKSYWLNVTPDQKTYSGRVEAPDGTVEHYSIIERYIYTPDGDEILNYRSQSSKVLDIDGHVVSYTQTIIEYEHDDEFYIVEKSTETCKAQIAGELKVHNVISTSYEHDDDWMLIGQVTSRSELFVYDSNTSIYTAYDPRDYDLNDLPANESLELVASEIRTTRYSEIDKETYGVETIIANKVYNEDEAEWQTLYIFEHDMVEAGSLQKNTRGKGKTLQVYAGSCPFGADLTVMDEPAKIFSIPTADWANIEDCYVYLAALVSDEYLKASASVPVLDPLPLIGINGLGNIIENGTLGTYYVRGYTISIDPNSGYTTDLEMEARKR